MYSPRILALFVVVFLNVSGEELSEREKRELRNEILTDHDLNVAVKVAQDFISRMQRLEENLVGSSISVQEDTPSHGQLIYSYPTSEALPLGKNALIANRASLYLVQKSCKRLRLPLEECVNTIRKYNFKSTPLGSKCAAQFGNVKCSSSNPYRSYDGTCNHLLHPVWGQTFTAYGRLLPAHYNDGIYEPRKSTIKRPLPSARFISNIVASNLDKVEKDSTLALASWTEFLANDLYHTPVSKMIHTGSSIECCRNDGKHLSPRYIHPTCHYINIPSEDPDYSPFRAGCMNYVRSLTAFRDDCSFGPADQMNQASHYLDGSMVYGTTAAKAISLRTMTGGKLSTSVKGKADYLPMSDTPESHCQLEDNNSICYKSGDSRVNLHPHQTTMYTVWVREHNRIAEILASLNPHWDDETLYQEARKIVIAEIQHITYKSYLPLILGESFIRDKNLDIKEKGFSQTFKEEENPSVSNSFATVAIRFVYSMLQGQIELRNEERTLNDTLLLKDNFNKPSILQEPDIMDQLIRGFSTQRSGKVDVSFVEDLTSQLFKGLSPFGHDIVSLDIQRGRDHGLPGYNRYRKFCGLSADDQFDTFLDTIPKTTLVKIKALYNHPDDVDLIIGAISEVPAGDGRLGSVMKCIIGEQMLRTKNGDRFFYDIGGKSHSFKEGQLNEIKKSSLARILCDNSENVEKMQVNVFKVPSSNNPLVNCNDPKIPKINLNEWKSIKK